MFQEKRLYFNNACNTIFSSSVPLLTNIVSQGCISHLEENRVDLSKTSFTPGFYSFTQFYAKQKSPLLNPFNEFLHAQQLK